MSSPDEHPLRLGGVGYGRLRFAPKALYRVQSDLTPLMDAAFFRDAPFTYVNMVVHIGPRTDLEPKLVQLRGREISFAIEVSLEGMRKLKTVEELAGALRGAVIDALLRIADRYGLNASALRAT